MDRIFEILQKVSGKYPSFKKRMAEAEAFQRWAAAVGPIIAQKTQPVAVKNQVLIVEVGHPVWRSELHHRKRDILKILNDVSKFDIGDTEVIQDLWFVEPRGRGGSAPNSKNLSQSRKKYP